MIKNNTKNYILSITLFILKYGCHHNSQYYIIFFIYIYFSPCIISLRKNKCLSTHLIAPLDKKSKI